MLKWFIAHKFLFCFFYRGSHYSMDSLMTLQGLPPPPAAPPVERMLSPELETVLPPPSQFHTLPRLHRWWWKMCQCQTCHERNIWLLLRGEALGEQSFKIESTFLDAIASLDLVYGSQSVRIISLLLSVIIVKCYRIYLTFGLVYLVKPKKKLRLYPFPTPSPQTWQKLHS